MSRHSHTRSFWQKADASPPKWFQGQHLDPWLGCVPVCACGYTMPPGDILWLVCDRVGTSVLSPWQPFSLWFLYICSGIYSIWKTAPHLVSNHKADDRGLLWKSTSFSLVSKAIVFSVHSQLHQIAEWVLCARLWVWDKVLDSHEYSVAHFESVKIFQKSGGNPVVRAAWAGFFLGWERPGWLKLYSSFLVSLSLFYCQVLKAVRTQTSLSKIALGSAFINSLPEKGCY